MLFLLSFSKYIYRNCLIIKRIPPPYWCRRRGIRYPYCNIYNAFKSILIRKFRNYFLNRAMFQQQFTVGGMKKVGASQLLGTHPFLMIALSVPKNKRLLCGNLSFCYYLFCEIRNSKSDLSPTTKFSYSRRPVPPGIR